jgi:phosphoglycerate kinase
MQNIDFKNKKVLVRVDFNVPLDNNQQITDDTRIRRAIPTLNYILERGGDLVICTHLGRPNGQNNPDLSTKHLTKRLSDLLGKPVAHADTTIGEKAKHIIEHNPIVLLENTRFYKEEKAGDPAFAKGWQTWQIYTLTMLLELLIVRMLPQLQLRSSLTRNIKVSDCSCRQKLKMAIKS